MTQPGSARSYAYEIVDDALEVLRERRGVDFSPYRRSTIERRLANRMLAARVSSPEDYLHLLRDGEDEADRLVANLTIKVSHFYRNASVFDRLRDELPALRARFGRLRAWSAGCAAGEEPYTLAILLEDGDEVVATDIDRYALEAVQRAVYPVDAFREAPSGWLEAYTSPHGQPGLVALREAVRARVHVLEHDLGAAAAPPPGPFHLVCCRNVLIYFDAGLQRRAMQLLTSALQPGGLLCLGEAEWPAPVGLLDIVDRRARIFWRGDGGAGQR